MIFIYSFYSFLQLLSFVSADVPAECLGGFDPIGDTCEVCASNFYSLKESPFLNVPFPRIDCQKKVNTIMILKLYVSDKGCSDYSICDGSKEYPIGGLIKALDRVHSETKMHSFSEVSLVLLGPEMFIMKMDLENASFKYYFRRINASINIIPAFCQEEDVPGCLKKTSDLLTVHIKSNIFFFFVSGTLKILNVAFKGYDLRLEFIDPTWECYNARRVCCTWSNINDSDLCRGVDLKGEYPDSGWALFNFEPNRENDNLTFQFPTLILENCVFDNIIDYPGGGQVLRARGIVQSLSKDAIKIYINNTIISSSYFSLGIIKIFGDSAVTISNNDVAVVNVNNLSISNYDPLQLGRSSDALIYVKNFDGNISISKCVLTNLTYKSNATPTVFFFNNNSKFMYLSYLLVIRSGYHELLACACCAKLFIEEMIILELDYQLSSNGTNLSYLSSKDTSLAIKKAFIHKLNFSQASFDYLAFNFVKNRNVIELIDVIVEACDFINFSFELGEIVISSSRFLDFVTNKIMIGFINCIVNFDDFLLTEIGTASSKMIVVQTTLNNKTFLFENSHISNIVFLDISKRNSIFSWSISTKSDRLTVKNLDLIDCRSLNRNKRTRMFLLDSFFLNLMEFSRINFYDHYKNTLCLLNLYDFKTLYFNTSSFRNIRENDYYFFIARCANCEMYMSNIVMENITIFFNLAYFRVTKGIYENLTFINIDKMEDRLYLGLAFITHQFCYMKNLYFHSSDSSEELRIYDLQDSTYIIFYFESNIETQLNNFTFVIPDSNAYLRESFVLNSLYNEKINISNLLVKNVYCRKDFWKRIDFENGIISFISSDTYLPEASTPSVVTITNLTVENCEYCKNGALGFVNILNVTVRNVFVKNSSSFRGGALFFYYAKYLKVENSYFNRNSASSLGGCLFILGGNEINIFNSTFDHSMATTGGTFYVRETMRMIFSGSSCMNSFADGNGGGFFLLTTNLLITYGFIVGEALLGGGGIYLKNSTLGISNGFRAITNRADTGGFIYVETALKVALNNITITRCSSFNKGSSILVYDSDALILEAVNFIENECASGYGTIYIENSMKTTYTFKIILCRGNIASDGSFFQLFSSVMIDMSNVTIHRNRGPLISVEGPFLGNNMSFLHFQNFLIIDSIGLDTTKIMIYLQNYNVSFQNIIIEEFQIGQYFIYVASCFFRFDSIYVMAKTPDPQQGFELIFLSIKLTEAVIIHTFFNGNGMKLGFLEIESCNLTLSDLALNHCTTESKKACIYSLQSSICVNNSNFYKNSGSYSGIFEILNSSFSFTLNNFFLNSVVRNRSPLFLVQEAIFDENSIDISVKFNGGFANRATLNQNIHIFSTEGTGICVDRATISILNNYWIHLEGIDSKVKAIWAFQSNLSLAGNIFQGFFSDIGGALRLESDGSYQSSVVNIFQNRFDNCRSDYGGVFFIRGNLSLSVIGNIFYKNMAIKYDSHKKGECGVGSIICPSCEARNLSIQSNEFLNNEAEFIFPTLAFMIGNNSQSFEEIKNNKLFNNSDKINFTVNFSFFPLKTRVFFRQNISLNYQEIIGAEPILIRSGLSFDLKIVLYDSIDQILIFDNLSIAEAFEVPESNRNLFLMRNIKTISKKGEFLFESLVINTDPNNYFFVKFEIILGLNQIMTFATDNLQLPPLQITFFSRRCYKGEIYVPGDQSCFPCPKGQYSLIDPMETPLDVQKCLNCPKNAQCNGGSLITPMKGYWRNSNTSTLMIECPSKASCLGFYGVNISEEDSTHGKCSAKSVGPLCFECEVGYARFSPKDTCKPCESEVQNYVKFSFVSLFIIIYIMLQVILSIQASRSSCTAILLKLLVNHIQQIGMISFVDMGWGSEFKSFFSIQEYLSFFDDLVPVECWVQNLDFNMFSMKVILMNLLPIVITFIAFLSWIITSACIDCLNLKRHSGKKLRPTEALRVIFFITVVLLFPGVMRKSLNMFNCIIIDDSIEKRVLIYSPELTCWGEEHNYYLYFTALPGLLIWGLISPVFMIYQLFLHRKSISYLIKLGIKTSMKPGDHETTVVESIRRFETNIFMKRNTRRSQGFQKKENPSEDQSVDRNASVEVDPKMLFMDSLLLSNRSLMDSKPIILHEKHKTEKKSKIPRALLLKFLFKGYSSKYYYWELFMFFKKFLLIAIGCVSDVIPQNLKGMLLLVLISFFMLVQIRFKPFERQFLNNVETFSLTTAFLTTNIGVLMVSSDLKSFLLVFLVLVVLVNSFFIIYWLKLFWDAGLKFFFQAKCWRTKNKAT